LPTYKEVDHELLIHSTKPDTHKDRLGPLECHTRRPEAKHSVTTARQERAVRNVSNPEYGITVRQVTRDGGQDKGDLFSSEVRVFEFRVLKLHVSAELIPRDGAVREAVDLLKQRVDLGFLYEL